MVCLSVVIFSISDIRALHKNGAISLNFLVISKIIFAIQSFEEKKNYFNN